MQDTGVLKCMDVDIPYVILRSKKRRRSLSLSFANMQLRIQVPMRVPVAAIKDLIGKRQHWIRKAFATQQNNMPAQTIEDGAMLPFLGNLLCLSVETRADKKRGCSVDGKLLRANIRHSDFTPSARQDTLRAELFKWYKQNAQIYVTQRLARWAEVTGLSFRSLKFNNARRVWGSCSHDNIIRINWRIIMAAPEIIDYLLVHELCHIAHKNHSPRFWHSVEQYLPEYAALRARLKKDGNAYLRSFR